MEPAEIKQKFDLIKDGKDLKLFFFTVQFGQVHVNITEDFQATFAYDKDSALQELKKNYQAGIPLIIKERASVPVQKIVSVLNAPNAPIVIPATTIESPKLDIHVEPMPTKEKTAQDFVWGMMLIADQYVLDEQDKKTIKDILKKIEIKKDDK
jgi:hypothetical protein